MLEEFFKGLNVPLVSYELHLREDSDLWIDGFTSRDDPHLVGRTIYAENSHHRPTVEVALGMPRVEFMAVLAHELGHAMLAPHAAALDLPTYVQEGFCEVVGEAFAATSDDKYAVRRLRARLRERIDPVYGRGYAEVAQRARLIGLNRLIEEITSARW